NGRIVKEIIDVVKSMAQSSIIIMVTNPLDIMTRLAYLISGIDRGRIIGMGGILDSVRFKYFISEKLKVKPYDINAYVIGEHGRYMIPLIREAKVNGEKVIEIIDEKDAREIVERTKVAGAEIVSFLKTGSAYFSPSVCAAEIVEVVLNDKNNEYSICCNLEGEFGANNTALNVPAIIGRRGIKKINEIELNEEEVKIFKLAAKEVDEGINTLREEGVL
ncbi:MAG: malate dehydrogenase, partial [Actinomycetia bacterium]|nr:malate dehydrogenase [Actinomycetes bacterium]